MKQEFMIILAFWVYWSMNISKYDWSNPFYPKFYGFICDDLVSDAYWLYTTNANFLELPGHEQEFRII